MIAVELRRAFANRMFVGALGIGLVLAVAHIATVAVPYGLGDDWSFWRAGSKGHYPESLFNTWMGGTPYSLWPTLYFFLLPLLVCLPHADSLYADVKGGLAANVVVRAGAAPYFQAKALAVFLTAGAVGVLPQLANLLGTALLVPVLKPEPAAGTFFVGPDAMLADVFYSMPWLYIAFFLVLCFAVCGIVACSCLAFAYAMSNRFMVLVAPFLVSAIAFFALSSVGLAGYSPMNLVNPAQAYAVGLPAVVAVYGALAVLEAAFLATRCRRFEAL